MFFNLQILVLLCALKTVYRAGILTGLNEAINCLPKLHSLWLLFMGKGF